MSPIRLPYRDQLPKRSLPLWLKSTLLISTGFASGFFAHNIEPPLFNLCTTLPSEFIFLIEQPQMANAMQSLEGIFQIVGILFATYAFCQRHVKTKNSNDPSNNRTEKKDHQP